VSTAYRVVTVDLGTITPLTLQQLVGTGAGITSFSIMTLPGGVDGGIKLGPSGDDIPLVESMTWEYDECIGPEMQGLYFRLNIAAAGTMVVAVFFGGGTATVGA
jgi:hypothetical protein